MLSAFQIIDDQCIHVSIIGIAIFHDVCRLVTASRLLKSMFEDLSLFVCAQSKTFDNFSFSSERGAQFEVNVPYAALHRIYNDVVRARIQLAYAFVCKRFVYAFESLGNQRNNSLRHEVYISNRNAGDALVDQEACVFVVAESDQRGTKIIMTETFGDAGFIPEQEAFFPASAQLYEIFSIESSARRWGIAKQRHFENFTVQCFQRIHAVSPLTLIERYLLDPQRFRILNRISLFYE